jgi:hypothetical protein
MSLKTLVDQGKVPIITNRPVTDKVLPQMGVTSTGYVGVIPTAPPDPAQVLIFNQVATTLKDAGLSDLFSYTNGKPSGWLWDTIVKGGLTSQGEIQTALESNAHYQQRFKVIFDQRQQQATGTPIHVMTPQEVLDYENQARTMLSQAGMPAQFYDSYTDFQNLMDKGVSLAQLSKAVNTSYNRVANTDPAIRAAFQDYYGVAGDNNLAAFFLDPTHFTDNLDKFSRAAGIGATGRELGLSLDRTQAENLAGLGLDESNTRSGFQQIAKMKDLFSATAGEGVDSNKQLTAEQQGVGAVFGTDATAAQQVEARRQERVGAFSGGGGAVESNRGMTGLENAR